MQMYSCCADPVLSVTALLGLYFDGIGNEIGTEMAMIEANKLNAAEALAKAREARQQRDAERRHASPQAPAAAATTAPAAPPADDHAPPVDGDEKKDDVIATQTGDESGQCGVSAGSAVRGQQ